jgi:hypothetical protein
VVEVEMVHRRFRKASEGVNGTGGQGGWSGCSCSVPPPAAPGTAASPAGRCSPRRRLPCGQVERQPRGRSSSPLVGRRLRFGGFGGCL